MKSVTGSLKIDLAQFRELEAFSAFASDLDAASKAQLDRGARLMELLKQGAGDPLPVEEEVVSLFLGTKGHVDTVPVGDVRRFESEFLAYLRRTHESLLKDIVESKKLSDDGQKLIVDSVEEFKKQFTTSDGTSLTQEADAEAMDAVSYTHLTLPTNREV